MVHKRTRPITDDERRSLSRNVPWFSLERRRMLRRDMERGELEVLTFSAKRVWPIMTCDGPPCCANSWFIDAGGGDFVSITSWKWLSFDLDHQFPGREVTIERLPESNLLASGTASGEPVPVLPMQDVFTVEAATVYRASDQP